MYANYPFQANASGDATLTITIHSGAVIFYASLTVKSPTNDSYDYSIGGIAGDVAQMLIPSAKIQAGTVNAGVGTIYTSVYGVDNSMFSLQSQPGDDLITTTTTTMGPTTTTNSATFTALSNLAFLALVCSYIFI